MRQLDWAQVRGISTDASYCLTPEDNLPWLSEGVRKDVEDGDGNEFGRHGKRGKICALHSSSALALNVFAYWHPRDRTPLGRALGLSQAIENVRFERKFDTGVAPHAPNLDVVLPLSDGSLFAIESKFTEWFGTSGRKGLKDAYLAGGKQRWAKVGLADAQEAAERYMDAPGFTRLDVPQLLKHMLGLANQPKPWHLRLIWYREPCAAADQMKDEISRFRDILGKDAERFSAMTYQELWGEIHPMLGDEHREYAEYLSARYF